MACLVVDYYRLGLKNCSNHEVTYSSSETECVQLFLANRWFLCPLNIQLVQQKRL